MTEMFLLLQIIVNFGTQWSLAFHSSSELLGSPLLGFYKQMLLPFDFTRRWSESGLRQLRGDAKTHPAC